MCGLAVTELVVLRVHRPYADEDTYVAAESWSIDDKAVLLIDQPDLPRDTVVRFEIVLSDGSKPIRAEGKVHKPVAPDGERPGGLRVRFRRFDAATKRFIDRVMDHRRKERRSRRPPALAPLVLEPEPAASEASPVSELGSEPAHESSPEIASAPFPSVVIASPEPLPEPTPAVRVAAEPTPSVRSDGPRSVQAPGNRDELLARLRARAKPGPAG